MRAIFRVDASPEMGAGHLMRCLALAEVLRQRGCSVVFAVSPETPRAVPALTASGLETVTVPAEAEAVPPYLANKYPTGCRWLIIDHYGLSRAQEQAFRDWARCILVIDDLANRPHDAELLLDQNLGRDPADYEGLLPEGARVLTGADYALLRPAFTAARLAALRGRQERDEVGHIVVAMGGTDSANVTGTVINGLARAGYLGRVSVVLGGGAPHLGKVRLQVAAMRGRGELLQDLDGAGMAELYTRADLAIGAAGSGAWERCCLGLPSLLGIIADNQRGVARALAESGAARLLGRDGAVTPESVAEGVASWLSTPTVVRREYSRRSALACDGRGAFRLSMIMSPPYAKGGLPIMVRPATAGDSEVLFTWQQEPSVRSHARNPEPPTRDQHEDWMQAVLSNPERSLGVVLLGGEPAGVLRLDRMESIRGRASFEVTIITATDYRRLGVAEGALLWARCLEPEAVLLAYVKPENAASRALFQNMGYQPCKGTEWYQQWPDTCWERMS